MCFSSNTSHLFWILPSQYLCNSSVDRSQISTVGEFAAIAIVVHMYHLFSDEVPKLYTSFSFNNMPLLINFGMLVNRTEDAARE